MTNPSTFTGKSIDAAVAKAANTLGVEPGELNYEILAGKTGGFALIKVVPGKKAAVELVEKLSGDGPAPEGAGGGEDEEPRREARRERSDRGDRRDDRGGRRDDRGGRGGDRGRRDDRGGRGDRRDDRGGRGDRRDDRGGRGDRRDDRGGNRRPRAPRAEELVVPADGPTEVEVMAAAGAELGMRGERAMELVREFLTAMGFGMTVTVAETEQNIRVDLESGVYHDALVANDLEVLDAFEHLVDKIVNASGDDRKKVVVDSMGIKAKADVDLGESARQLAERAMAEGRTFKLGPLDPRSRRIVHLTLRDMDGVVTKSEGEGVFRRVCIIPKDAQSAYDEDDAGDRDDD